MPTADDFPWPNNARRLFREGDDYYGLAHIGCGDTDTEFFMYMEGFKDAADRLVDEAIAIRDIKKLDTWVFPILFLYRQYLELALKHMYLVYSRDRDKKVVFSKIGHDLSEAWRLVEPLLLTGANEHEAEEVRIAGRYIAQFYKEDSTSFTFRYPVTKGLDLTIKRERRIDLVNLKDGMQELETYLSACFDWLDDQRRSADNEEPIDDEP